MTQLNHSGPGESGAGAEVGQVSERAASQVAVDGHRVLDGVQQSTGKKTRFISDLLINLFVNDNKFQYTARGDAEGSGGEAGRGEDCAREGRVCRAGEGPGALHAAGGLPAAAVQAGQDRGGPQVTT